MEVGGSSSSAQLPKNPRLSSRNNNDQDHTNKRIRVSAPQCGNLEMPPDDNFTWRKYGQKQILNAKYPRSYYRCTHHKLYKCKAKKQVQRLNNDPTTLEILYRGEHTCHMSSTAPSIPPPSLQLFVNQQHHISPFHDHHSMITNIPHNSSHLWRHTLDHQHQQDHHHHHHHRHQLYGLSSSSSSTGCSSSNVLCNSTNTRAGLSTAGSIQQGGLGSGNQIHVPTDDSWIDVFNSGRSGSNALELIFTPTHDTNDS
ncbi:probable WRKY transcription factor 30 [Amaranthus tricolor]|uniref:probable WRKY transcription factor 30 n=1 Tax=Amaranthus tricolor TaxID=29722 RepID=UPI00258FB6ED|nr:probable WRKY transcription factor 30 [Amaranthus tricolor]